MNVYHPQLPRLPLCPLTRQESLSSTDSGAKASVSEKWGGGVELRSEVTHTDKSILSPPACPCAPPHVCHPSGWRPVASRGFASPLPFDNPRSVEFDSVRTMLLLIRVIFVNPLAITPNHCATQ